MTVDIISIMTEEKLMELLERYRAFGPLPGILLAFLKSFVPPMPTILILGLNALVYGLWLGFLYSWTGMVSGCMLTFLIVRRIAGHRQLERWTRKPKVHRGMQWVRRNAFSYVFLLSLLPVGPFVVINIAAGLAGMRIRSFFLAIAAGKAIMVFTVTYLGYDMDRYMEAPWRLLYIALLVSGSLIIGKKLEARFAREASQQDDKGLKLTIEGSAP
jgi:uncharacterized membrane protein YdjX (TVP38/TMEM64 family)